jgi:hypothetical protein
MEAYTKLEIKEKIRQAIPLAISIGVLMGSMRGCSLNVSGYNRTYRENKGYFTNRGSLERVTTSETVPVGERIPTTYNFYRGMKDDQTYVVGGFQRGYIEASSFENYYRKNAEANPIIKGRTFHNNSDFESKVELTKATPGYLTCTVTKVQPAVQTNVQIERKREIYGNKIFIFALAGLAAGFLTLKEINELYEQNRNPYYS